MADIEDTGGFLTMPFDWYVLEKWHGFDSLEDSVERRQKHIQLGIAYAELGHEGRRPYSQKAFAWNVGELDSSSVPRDLTEVPKDLLTAAERRICNPESTLNSLWIRTNHGPGTDERFQELMDGFGDDITSRMDVVQHARRYDAAEDNLKSLFAFFPALLEPDVPQYVDNSDPFDSDEIQNALFLRDHPTGLPEEDRLSLVQAHFFVADAEAMRTGFILWVVPDQYGVPLLSERIQPWSLDRAMGLRSKRTLQEFRDEIASGWYGHDPKYSSDIVGPWEPPT